MVKKSIISLVVVVCIFFCAWAIYSEKRSRETVQPPPGATNLTGFLQLREPATIRKFVFNGKVHLEVIGKPVVIPPLSVPSGPPVYIFDEKGVFVDWAADVGDAPSFVRKWGGFSNATPVTTEAAKELVNNPQH